MRFLFSIITLPLRMLKFLNPFFYLKIFIKWTFIICMTIAVGYSYIMDDSQKESLKTNMKTESSEMVDTLSNKAFDKIEKESMKIDIEKLTEDKIKEVASQYTQEDIISMGRERFMDMVNTEVKNEINER